MLMLESAFAMLLHHAPTQYPARAARQWIPPTSPPERLDSGSRRVSRQSCSPVGPAEYPARAARQWIPPSIPPSRQSCSPVGPAEYPARAARQWIPPSIPRERLASGSRPPEQPASGCRRVSHQSSWPAHPAQCPASRAGCQWIPPSIPLSIPELLASRSRRVSRQSSWIPPSVPPEQPASGSAEHPAEYPRVARQWIAPSIPLSIPCRWSSRSGSPVLASGSRQYPARAARQSVLLNVPPGAQLGLHFMLVPSCFECALRLGKGDAFVLLWAVNKHLRLIPRRVSF